MMATAGCTGDADDPDGNGGTDDDGDETSGSCDDLRGTPTSFDPGDRQFPYLFEYPDTFEEYNSQINESDSGIGAQLGHVESAKSASYPVNIAVRQHKGPITDEAAATNWVTSFDSSERIDWTFTYDGEEIDVYEDRSIDDPSSSVWRFLLPARETDGVRGVHVQFMDDRDHACMDVLTTIARELTDSLTANPEWA